MNLNPREPKSEAIDKLGPAEGNVAELLSWRGGGGSLGGLGPG